MLWSIKTFLYDIRELRYKEMYVCEGVGLTFPCSTQVPKKADNLNSENNTAQMMGEGEPSTGAVGNTKLLLASSSGLVAPIQD